MKDDRERTPNPPTPEDDRPPATLSEAARALAEAMTPRKLLRNPSQEAPLERPEAVDNRDCEEVPTDAVIH